MKEVEVEVAVAEMSEVEVEVSRKKKRAFLRGRLASSSRLDTAPASAAISFISRCLKTHQMLDMKFQFRRRFHYINGFQLETHAKIFL